MNVFDTWIVKTPISHRGLHNDEIPENSIAAFENSAKHGYPIELDVRLLDDNTVTVFHDEKLGRMTGSDGYLANLTKDKLKDIHLLNTDERIPTFEDVLTAINGSVPILVEIKGFSKSIALETRLLEMIKSYNGDIAVEAFDPHSLEYFYKHAPDIMRGQLAGKFLRNSDIPRHEGKLLSKLKLNDISHPDFIAYNVTNLPYKYVTRTNLPVIGWTLRSQTQTDKASAYMNNYIFENFIPELKN